MIINLTSNRTQILRKLEVAAQNIQKYDRPEHRMAALAGEFGHILSEVTGISTAEINMAVEAAFEV